MRGILNGTFLYASSFFVSSYVVFLYVIFLLMLPPFSDPIDLKLWFTQLYYSSPKGSRASEISNFLSKRRRCNNESYGKASVYSRPVGWLVPNRYCVGLRLGDLIASTSLRSQVARLVRFICCPCPLALSSPAAVLRPVSDLGSKKEHIEVLEAPTERWRQPL